MRPEAKLKFRALIVSLSVSVAVVLALSGCGPEPVSPSSSPSASVSSSPVASPSASPSPTASVSSLVIPSDCNTLVALTIIHQQFASNFQSIYFAADSGDESAQSFATRGGLTCLWGIPNSDGGFVTVFVAPRGTATDAQQAGIWQSAGMQECPPFLDECFYTDENNEIGELWTVHVLVEGFEIQVQGTAVAIDPLLVVARAAASNMGYN